VGSLSVVAEQENFRCPSCGASASDGGCKDFKKCCAAIANLEDEYTREVTRLLDHSNNRPFDLLMAGLEALDLLNIGLAVTNSAGLLLLANQTAERVLNARDGLELTARGVLRSARGASPDLSDLLRQAARAQGPGRPETSGAVLAVARPSGKRPFTLLVRSARGKLAPSDVGGPAALVFILDPELPVEATEAELRHLYGLTYTETRLANLLMEGKTLDECCAQLQIRRTTGRMHLRHLFEKAGVQRQSQLVSLLFKSIGLLRTGGEDGRKRSMLGAAAFKSARAKDFANQRARVLDPKGGRASAGTRLQPQGCNGDTARISTSILGSHEV
jgi:DNA-binding CsgD family transcriptional regulator